MCGYIARNRKLGILADPVSNCHTLGQRVLRRGEVQWSTLGGDTEKAQLSSLGTRKHADGAREQTTQNRER